MWDKSSFPCLATEYGEKENDHLRERFSINKEDFPVYKLFIEGKKEPIDFKGEIKAEELIRFAKKEAGLWIGELVVDLVRMVSFLEYLSQILYYNNSCIICYHG